MYFRGGAQSGGCSGGWPAPLWECFSADSTVSRRQSNRLIFPFNVATDSFDRDICVEEDDV